MLSRSDNELLTRVGPGTAMGDMLRQYWHPTLLSSELPEADGPPLRVRLLGEDLVAFRDTDGRVGLLGDHCPHRGASLFFGRNEERGMRCVYHGWKFDADGRCIDMPNEPAESNFKHKITHTAYQCRERGGVIWVYMGPARPVPELPALEWSLVPEGHNYISKRWQSCNWAQSLEGGIDNSHSPFLHSRLHLEDFRGKPDELQWKWRTNDKHPRFEVVNTEYGCVIGSQRNAEEDSYFYRITQFLMPFYTLLGGGGGGLLPGTGLFDPLSFGGHAWVPVDDENTMTWSMTWNPKRKLTAEELKALQTTPMSGLHVGLNALLPPTGQPGGAWRTVANAANDYLLDYEAQKTTWFFGVSGTAMQDQAVQESMGPIYDRTKEHLGSSDSGIIRVRRRWLDAAKALRDEGTVPPGVSEPAAYFVRAASVVLPRSTNWVEATEEYRMAGLAT